MNAVGPAQRVALGHPQGGPVLLVLVVLGFPVAALSVMLFLQRLQRWVDDAERPCRLAARRPRTAAAVVPATPGPTAVPDPSRRRR